LFIEKSIKSFIVFREDSILDALVKIDENKSGAIFVLDYNGSIEGIITDGDFRRWLTKHKKFELSANVSIVMNSNFVTHPVDADPEIISASFSDEIKIIPLLDYSLRIVAVALPNIASIQIGEYFIKENSPCFVIAEIGNNHNGDIKLAKKLVDLAIESGADCIKFQLRDLGSLYKNNGSIDDNTADLGAQYVLDLLSRFQLKNEELLEVFDYCKAKGGLPLCTPWDLNSLNILEDYGMSAYKVSSADLTNSELLEALAKTGKPLICSTGMSTEFEIKRAIQFFHDTQTPFILLHCNSTYPTPYRDVNLRYMKRLKELSGNLVGYSGHERGFITPVIAVGLGAKIIEKHFTIDKDMEGNDHNVSLLPSEFADMVKQIRLTEEVLGDDSVRTITQGESINREVMAKSLVTNQNIKKGNIITREMIEVKSPGQGLQPYLIDKLLGIKAKRDFLSGDYFFESDIMDSLSSARNYSFNRLFGIPARYHDYGSLISKTNVDFVEFHLSYRDLDENLTNIFNKKQKIDFLVHSPELFYGDHILNLCSDNLEYRKRSIDELTRVIEVSRSLKAYFPSTTKPLIVVNVGGYDKAVFLPKAKKTKMYEQVANALDQVDSSGVELIIQTMPPFPWHFGGQSHHNLFVDPHEISEFCKKTGYKICLDISHSQMACSYFNWSLSDFIKIVSTDVAHLHISDASGIDGEGIQIGGGDVNFDELAKTLDSLTPNIPFIPEIWQGHKQHGAGFWQGLEFLEKYL